MAICFFKTKRPISVSGELKDMYLATIETSEAMDVDKISEQV